MLRSVKALLITKIQISLFFSRRLATVEAEMCKYKSKYFLVLREFQKPRQGKRQIKFVKEMKVFLVGIRGRWTRIFRIVALLLNFEWYFWC